MAPIFGFTLFFFACVVVAVVARKRGRSAILYPLASAAGAFFLVIITSNVGGGGLAAGFMAFLAPAIALFVLISSKNSEQLAVESGSHGNYRKCPFCAEPVRKEAVKCKHCGSDLKAADTPA